jgi:hypothetical protein
MLLIQDQRYVSIEKDVSEDKEGLD